jgi:hypothetical protein
MPKSCTAPIARRNNMLQQAMCGKAIENISRIGYICFTRGKHQNCLQIAAVIKKSREFR